jgi:small subunit ribosomal protein S4
VRVGDTFGIRERSRKNPFIAEEWAVATLGAPVHYLELNKADFSAQLISRPARDEVPIICELAQVVEFYSK